MQSLKPIARFIQKNPVLSPLTTFFPIHLATLVFFGVIVFFFALCFAWLTGEVTVTNFFAKISQFQENPPFWVTVPSVSHPFYLFLPTLILIYITQIILKASPQPKTWSRNIIVFILFFLSIRYFCWRILTTLNLATPINGIFSIGLLSIEIIVLLAGFIQLYLMLRIKERRQEAEQYSKAVREGNYLPTVDILIPTYNEPEFILKRTIIGCQAIEYPHKNIYLLDDTKRPEIKELAIKMDCNYITRPDNRYAKAGNLNHAIPQTNGEFIAIFDADFIPTKNFLERTIGYFKKEKIALVQTPQSFYNPDPISRNLGLEQWFIPEEELFYRHVQLLKDGVKSVVCAGTSFIVRRSALREVGYFTTESISEDYFTGIRLSAKGYELVYLNEKLSAGLAAESISTHISQRLRWGRGTLQAFFIKSNPLTIPGLNIQQRLGHLEGLLSWFSVITRLLFFLMPILYAFTNIIPVQATYVEAVYIFLPYYLINFSVYHWLNYRSRTIVLSDIAALISGIPIVITIFQVMFKPFQKGFRVTPKGISRNRYIYNCKLALPLIILWLATAISICIYLKKVSQGSVNYQLGLFWSIQNLFSMTVALFALLDAPKPDHYEWFSLNYSVELQQGNKIIMGITQNISEAGAEIIIDELLNLQESILINLLDEKLKLFGKITQINAFEKGLKIIVEFQSLSRVQERKLIELLFCQPERWKVKATPGELQSFWLLLGSVVRMSKMLLFALVRAKPNTKFIHRIK
ncbi:cellulose synthase catalytic subunit [Aphanothece hegewaldii CCALA 016]|uniref:cellulose synthase (UDP-forming) n=1 Tax=Aphanothece hegewaldii CCALA 016 TaxID=2107694 RepID=A0A2T1LX58_9CHRO|nr:glycosyltransferase [Aphanothece hegewaldii]PSF36769.1 cellulose synthase catalytic subunit [Aphanothece hegewaldii CCALA 016]